MSDTTLIQQRAIQLYTRIKTEIGDIKAFADKPNAVLFCTILTKAATAVEEYRVNGVKLSSAEKQSTAIAIGKLFITELKGDSSADVAEFELMAVSMIDMLIGFSNELVEIKKDLQIKCSSIKCVKTLKHFFN